MSRKKSNVPFSLFAFQDVITSVCGIVVMITLIFALQLTSKSIEEEVAAIENDVEKIERLQNLQRQIQEVQKELDALENVEIKSALDQRTLGKSLEEIEEENEQVKKRLQNALEEKERLQVELKEQEERKKNQKERFEQENREIEKKIQELQNELDKINQSSRDAKTQDANKVLYEYIGGESKQKPWFVELSGKGIVAHPSQTDLEKHEFHNQEEFLLWAIERAKAREYFVFLVRPSGAKDLPALVYILQELGYDVGVDLIAEEKALEFLNGAPSPGGTR